MIIKAVTETIGGEEMSVGISFIAENSSELSAFCDWMEHKNIGSIGEDGKEITMSFADVNEFLSDLGDV